MSDLRRQLRDPFDRFFEQLGAEPERERLARRERLDARQHRHQSIALLSFIAVAAGISALALIWICWRRETMRRPVVQNLDNRNTPDAVDES